ncbi:MAG TPA: sensor histidine kinase [Parafilimonas sp.]|nr:sensor histidine kinase [Parafilimonas sp.]
MEFDNDRPVKKAYRIEILYWVLLALMNPLVNSLTVFLHDSKIWWVLFGINLFILPAYIFYSIIIVRKFLFEKKYAWFFASTILFLAIIQLLVFGIYSIAWDFSNQTEQSYFTYSSATFVREFLWSCLYTLIAIGIYFIKKALDERELLIALEKESNSFRLKYLRSQLNPHFLFNTLNSIYALSMQKSDKTPDVVVKLADLMRYLIYECNEDKVPLNKEIEFIRNYIEIEKIRHKADIRFTIEGETDDIMIEPFLFISFVENGFKHAFDNAFSNAFVYINIKVKPEQIELSVINNTSIDLETQTKKIQGTGLRNSKSILDLLYPTSHKLNIIQTEKEESRSSELRIKNAKKRLESLYPDSHTLDVILSNNAFTVSLIIKPGLLDKVHHS